MSEKSKERVSKDSNAPSEVAIESKLPLTAIDVESQKDMASGRHHPLRSLHKWFAARPTPVARLATIASAYPGTIDPDKLLKLMQIGPKELDSDLAEYVERKFTESKNGATLDDHYHYPNPNTQTPTEKQLDSLHDEIKQGWGGSLPTVMDPTAGRGIIPFESIRYGFPTKANELNPVPSLIMKVALEYAPQVGSLTPEIHHWRDKIQKTAKEGLKPYYPTEQEGSIILNSAVTYLINCESCGGEIPLVVKWWLNKSSKGGDAIRPIYTNGEVSYEHVKVQNTDKYDPDEGPVKGGDAECPHCGVVTENAQVREKIAKGEFEYSVYGVNYEDERGNRKFRGGSEPDQRGMEKAAERVKNDFEMIDFLTESYPGGFTDRVKNYGVNEWRDIFTPRQLVVHYEYLQAFREYLPEIRSEYTQEKAEAIASVLTLCASRVVMFNSRLSKWYDQRGIPHGMFAQNNFVLKKMGADNNLSAPRRGYIKNSDHVIDSYEKIASYVRESKPADVRYGDAANITSDWSEGSVDIAIVDPPYYQSIQYSELADVFYIFHKEYLRDVFPDLYDTKLTNKKDEAVANPSRFEEFDNKSKSKKELADDFYEAKMGEIFSDVYKCLSDGGVMTIMFTHREIDAWDTLTSALIEAGFTITATHPIKTEMGDRIGAQDKASADSSILLIGRKRERKSDKKTLWGDVKSDIARVARKEAEEIIQSDYSISKTDMAISAYGPTLQRYASEYPVVNKKGEEVRPKTALSKAQEEVTSVIAEAFLETAGIDQLDSLTRWYVLAWLIYENDTIPYDEANQLGVAAGVDIENIKRPTKLWRGGSEVNLQSPSDRVQNITKLKTEGIENPSTRKYPVNPTDTRFTHTIDLVHSVIHVYEDEGSDAAWQWITDRNLKSNQEFKIAVAALLEVLPSEETMRETLVNLVSGDTGEYLSIDLSHIDLSGSERQSSLSEEFE